MICMRELTKSANRTNGRSWSNQKPLHRGSRTCRPFAPNQRPFKEDRGFIGWLGKSAILLRIIFFQEFQRLEGEMVMDLPAIRSAAANRAILICVRHENNLELT